MELSTWPVVAGLFVALALAGKILDAGLNKLHNPAIKERLLATAIKLDELSYVELLHSEAGRARAKLIKLFGPGIFISRLAYISILPATAIAILLFTYVDLPDRRVDQIAVQAFLPIFILAIALFNVLSDQVSLVATRFALGRVRPQASSLIAWFLFDLVIFFVVAPLPFTGFTPPGHGSQPATGRQSVFLSVYHGLTSKETLTDPSLFFSMLFTLFMLATAALPTLIYLSYVTYDLSIKFTLSPLLRFASRIREYASGTETPLTWALGLIGLIPAIVKALFEAFS